MSSGPWSMRKPACAATSSPRIPAFSLPIESGQKQFQTATAKVGSLTSDNAGQQKRLERVKQLANDWFTNVAMREIALMKDPATQSKARELEASGAGKKAMDGLRGVVQEMDAEERSLLTVRSEASKAASASAMFAMMAGGAITLLLSLVGAIGIAFAVTRPIQRITTEMGILAGGNTSAAISATEHKDEIGQMAQAVQVFKDNAIEVERLKLAASRNRSTQRRSAQVRDGQARQLLRGRHRRDRQHRVVSLDRARSLRQQR